MIVTWLARFHQASAGIAASCWHQGVAGHLSIHTSTNVVCRFFVVGGIWHVGCTTSLTTTAYELRSELPGWQVSATDDGDKEIKNSQLSGVVIMFDLTTSEQFGPTLTPSKQRDGSSSRPIRFQSASEEQILSFFLKFTIEEQIAHFDSVGALP